MSLKNPDFSAIRYKNINLDKINSSYRMMVENDKFILPEHNIAPTIWSAKHVEDNGGYSKGDTVWVNTEDPDEFTASHMTELHEYLEAAYPGDLNMLDPDDTQGLFNLCKRLVTGEMGYSRRYYIGNLTDKVQIRVSRVDHNTALPNNSSYWKDFFYESGTAEWKREALASFNQHLTDVLSEHMAEYHMKGLKALQDVDELQYVKDTFLLRDLSNLKTAGKQNYFSHKYGTTNRKKGFDWCKLFIRRKYSNGCFKWFRLWNSGYLEHGGLIDTASPTTTGDARMYGSDEYKLYFNWMYQHNGSKTAPRFDFPYNGDAFYFRTKKLKPAATEYNYSGSGNVNSDYRYSVSLSPLAANGTFYDEIPHIEANTMNNDSLCFVINPKIRYISYFVSGFTTSNVKKY